MTARSTTRRADSIDEAGWLQRYLAGALAAGECAWFEAYLLTREPLVAALELANDLRDRQARLRSQAQGAGTRISQVHGASAVSVRVAVGQRLAAARELGSQQVLAATGRLLQQHSGDTSDHRGGGGSAIEEAAASDRMLGIALHGGAHHVAARGDAEHLRPAVAAQRVRPQAPGQISGANGEHAASGSWLFDAVDGRITVARSGHDQDPATSREPTERAAEHARRGIARTRKADADGQDPRAGGNRPGRRDLDREAVAATAVGHDLGDDETRVAGDSVTTTAIARTARPGNDPGCRRAMAVASTVVGAAITDECGPRSHAAAGKVGMVEIEPAVEHADNHIGAGFGLRVQPDRQGRQRPRPAAAGQTVALLHAGAALGRIAAQAQRAPALEHATALAGTYEHCCELGHEQRICLPSAQAVAHHLFTQLPVLRLQLRHGARRQRQALGELPALRVGAHAAHLLLIRFAGKTTPAAGGAHGALVAALPLHALRLKRVDPRTGAARAPLDLEELFMNMLNSRRPLNATLIAALSLSFSSIAFAGDPACLTRGTGAGEHFLGVESISDVTDWLSQGALLVHSTNNMEVCSALGVSCNVAEGDVITISATDNGKLVLHRTRPTGSPTVRDIATMVPSANGRYLKGFSAGSNGGQGQQVFLYYTGTALCTDSGLSYPPNAQCRSFEFEVFPVNVLEGDRPDAQGADWASGECPTSGQQPGSGGTIEPPEPEQ